jgi:hypothetical protein
MRVTGAIKALEIDDGDDGDVDDDDDMDGPAANPACEEPVATPTADNGFEDEDELADELERAEGMEAVDGNEENADGEDEEA